MTADTENVDDAAQSQPPDDIPGVAIWAQILETLERMVKSGASAADGLDEAVPECVKNILLVMGSAGYIAAPPPSSHSASAQGEQAQVEERENAMEDGERERVLLQKRLWDVTTARLERFLPGLLAEVFPPPPLPVVVSAAQVSEAEQVDKVRTITGDAEGSDEKPVTAVREDKDKEAAQG